MKALIFDCDGVLVDTERDGHRVAFNRAFEKRGLGFDWSVPLYGQLLQVAGGKERLRHYFSEYGWPEHIGDRGVFVRELHALKTDLFMELIEAGELPIRSGIARLIDEAASAGVKLAICSTSNEKAVRRLVRCLLGADRESKFAAILAGDIVSKKKPDPEIYELARRKLEVSPDDCLVVEDSRNGLLAARAAGMCCLITTSGYTVEEDFSEAACVVPDLGDPPAESVTLRELKEILSRCVGVAS